MLSKRLLFTLLVLLGACGQRQSAARERIPPAVQVTPVERRTVVRSISLLGTVVGEEQAMVMSKIAGRVTSIVRPEGSEVKAGEPILFVQNDIPGMDYKPGPVVSPIDGVVGKVYTEVGSMVSQAAPVAAVARFGSRVRVKANISDADLRFARRGALATVTSSALPGDTFSATVALVSPMVDPLGRSATVELTLPNPGRKLVPGMTAAVRLRAEERRDVTAVPISALFTDGEPRVAVLEGTTVRMRPVRIGLAGDEYFEIVAGLADGEKIITVGKERVREGETVNPIEAGSQ